MASDNAWPVVQPLPRFIVQLGLALSFVAGHLLLWNDRRVEKSAGKVAVDQVDEKPLGVPVFK